MTSRTEDAEDGFSPVKDGNFLVQKKGLFDTGTKEPNIGIGWSLTTDRGQL